MNKLINNKKSRLTLIIAGLVFQTLVSRQAQAIHYVYREDFSSDPGWTSDDPAKLRWDSLSGTFHGTQVNTEGTYAYINIPGFDPNQSWQLEWDHIINSDQWSAGLTLGLFDDQVRFPFGAGLDMSIADFGHGTGLMAYGWEQGLFSPAWSEGVWYHNSVAYDADSHQLTLVVTVRSTSTVLVMQSHTVPSLPTTMTRFGVSRVHIKNTGPGANPFATVDYNLDNITLYQQPFDSDGDGIPDVQDACPNTPTGEIVNASGCSISQLVPASGPWRNHGEYVSAVSACAQQFLAQGLITAEQKDEIVSSAALSDVGKRR